MTLPLQSALSGPATAGQSPPPVGAVALTDPASWTAPPGQDVFVKRQPNPDQQDQQDSQQNPGTPASPSSFDSASALHQSFEKLHPRL